MICPDFLNKEAALENCMNDEEFFESMLEAFVSESKLEELKDSYITGDYDSFGVYAHAVKSQARIIGATRLYEDSLAMENAADNKDIEYIKEKYDGYIDLYGYQYRKIKEAIGEGR